MGPPGGRPLTLVPSRRQLPSANQQPAAPGRGCHGNQAAAQARGARGGRGRAAGDAPGRGGGKPALRRRSVSVARFRLASRCVATVRFPSLRWPRERSSSPLCACALSPFPAQSERIAPIAVPLLLKDLSVDAPGGVATPAAGRPSERDGRASRRAREREKVASHVERVSDGLRAYRPGWASPDGKRACSAAFPFSSLPSPPSF